MIRACWREMRSSVVVCRSSRPITRPAAGTRNTWIVGCAPVQTTRTPGTGAAWPVGPAGLTSRVYPPKAGPEVSSRRTMPRPVVTFDAGLTLVELDLDFLALRLAEQGVSVDPAALVAASPAAWHHYDALAPTSTHPWKEFMAKLLEGAGVRDVGA